MSVAHAAGIVHRDIKPENVMVRDDGLVKVLDFGLARLLPTDASPESLLKNPSQLVGTTRYMSPEQALGEHVGPASDVFALGVMLYEMVSGRHPFHAYTGSWGTRGIVRGDAFKVWRRDASGAPTLADSIITAEIRTVSDIKVSPDGKLLMFTAEIGSNQGFWFYSLANPAKPAYVGKYLVPTTSRGVHTGKFATIGGRLYAFGAQDPTQNPPASALLILDVTAIDQ